MLNESFDKAVISKLYQLLKDMLPADCFLEVGNRKYIESCTHSIKLYKYNVTNPLFNFTDVRDIAYRIISFLDWLDTIDELEKLYQPVNDIFEISLEDMFVYYLTYKQPNCDCVPVYKILDYFPQKIRTIFIKNNIEIYLVGNVLVLIYEHKKLFEE